MAPGARGRPPCCRIAGRLPAQNVTVRLHSTCLQSIAHIQGRYRKYEAEGGPGVREILELIHRESDRPEADANAFLRAIAFNRVVGGSDAHAKNLAFLLEPVGGFRLAPLFDLASILPYPGVARPREVRLAMRIGREYRLWRVGARQWRRLAEMSGLDPEEVVDTAAGVAAAVRAKNEEVYRRLRGEGLDGPVLEALRDAVGERAGECLELMGR